MRDIARAGQAHAPTESGDSGQPAKRPRRSAAGFPTHNVGGKHREYARRTGAVQKTFATEDTPTNYVGVNSGRRGCGRRGNATADSRQGGQASRGRNAAGSG